jgi:hypothetical protein
MNKETIISVNVTATEVTIVTRIESDFYYATHPPQKGCDGLKEEKYVVKGNILCGPTVRHGTVIEHKATEEMRWEQK